MGSYFSLGKSAEFDVRFDSLPDAGGDLSFFVPLAARLLTAGFLLLALLAVVVWLEAVLPAGVLFVVVFSFAAFLLGFGSGGALCCMA